MDIQSFENTVDGLDAKQLMALRQILDARLHLIIDELAAAVPKGLPEGIQYFYAINGVSDIVYNGGHTYLLFENIGCELGELVKSEWIEKTRQLLQPVADAWSPFGVTMQITYADFINGGSIEATFNRD